ASPRTVNLRSPALIKQNTGSFSIYLPFFVCHCRSFKILALALNLNTPFLMLNNHKRAVIWDLDGTLIDSSHLHWEAWQKVMEAESIALTYEQYVADFGKRNDEILRGRLGADLSDEFIARISLAKEEVYRDLIRTKGLKLLPGARYWLERLKAEGWLQAL